MKIGLFYLAEATYGGWMTCLAHLNALLKEQHTTRIYKVGSSTEDRLRPMGYGMAYRNIRHHEIMAAAGLNDQNLIVVADKKHAHLLKLFPDNTGIIVHDPTEICPELLLELPRFRVKTMRTGIHNRLDQLNVKNQMVPMPFKPMAPRTCKTKMGAAAVSRIDWDKNTHLIIEANNKGACIDIWGKMNTVYDYHTLEKASPGWKKKWYRGTFPRGFSGVNEILAPKKFLVDMSSIKNDGGGTQLTFMEAWDNGCVVVLNKDWFKYAAGEMQEGMNCVAASTADDLVRILEDQTEQYDRIIERGLEDLKNHADTKGFLE